MAHTVIFVMVDRTVVINANSISQAHKAVFLQFVWSGKINLKQCKKVKRRLASESGNLITSYST